MCQSGVKRRRSSSLVQTRTKSCEYSLKGIRLCKTMFINTLGMTEKKVRGVRESERVDDRRGKNKKTHALSETAKQNIEDHINSFNPDISHYRRAHAPNRLYLDHSLTIRDMFKNYKTKVGTGAVCYSR